MALEVAARHPKLLEAALAATPEQLRKVRGWRWRSGRSYGVAPGQPMHLAAPPLPPLPQDRDGLQDLAVEILAEYDAGRVDGEEAQRQFTDATAPYSLLVAMPMIHKPEVALDIMSITRLPGESEAEEAARWRRIAVSTTGRRRCLAAAPLPLKGAHLLRPVLSGGRPCCLCAAAGVGCQQGAAAGVGPALRGAPGPHAAAGQRDSGHAADAAGGAAGEIEAGACP